MKIIIKLEKSEKKGINGKTMWLDSIGIKAFQTHSLKIRIMDIAYFLEKNDV